MYTLANNALFTDLTRVKQRLKIDNAIAKAHVIITGGVITGIALDDAGSGYTDTPDVAIIGDGHSASVTAIRSGKIITGFTIAAGGSAYTLANTTVVISGGGVGALDDFLITLVNGVSSFIESRLNVKDGWVVYKGVFRERTVTGEIIQSSDGQYYETIYYPVKSISKVELTLDWTSYDDYAGPFVKADNYRVYLPNDTIRPIPGASRIDYIAGDNDNIPEDILDVALEIIQRKYDESPVGGKNQLGQSSVIMTTQASEEINFRDLKPEWNERINQYRKPLISKSGSVMI